MAVLKLDSKELAALAAALVGTPHEALRKKLIRAGTKIKVSSAKAKGRALQMWVCERISVITGVPYDQSDDECEIHSREMGQAGEDIVLRGKARKLFPFAVECKNQETLSLGPTIEQAKTNTSVGRDWLIVHKNKRLAQPIAIMEWSTFEGLLHGRPELE